MIVEKASGQVIGGAGLRIGDSDALDADLGYVLARAKWGQGIMTEACERLLDVAFGWLSAVNSPASASAPWQRTSATAQTVTPWRATRLP